MKRFFRKAIVIAISLVTVGVAVNAQEKGDKAAGANLSISDSRKIIGIGAKFQYNVSKPFRLESAFQYIFEDYSINRWNLFLNGHLLLPLSKRMKIYPVAGLGILQQKYDLFYSEELAYTSEKSSDIFWAYNIGGGIDFKLKNNLIINAELNYKLWENNRRNTYLSAGIVYIF